MFSECLIAYKSFLEESSLLDDNLKNSLELLLKDLDDELTALKTRQDAFLEEYRKFYNSRPHHSRRYNLEMYIRELYGIAVGGAIPIDETRYSILGVLISRGFLETLGLIKDHKFTYSPKASITAYLGKKGPPSRIVLGCGQAVGRDVLETLELPLDTWCGCCPSMPHLDAMTVSLHEPSADILCDLNHPDLWSSLSDSSADSIYDETWALDSYTVETLQNIARVLRVGGEFWSNDYKTSVHEGIKSKLAELGFKVIEESQEKRILK